MKKKKKTKARKGHSVYNVEIFRPDGRTLSFTNVDARFHESLVVYTEDSTIETTLPFILTEIEEEEEEI